MYVVGDPVNFTDRAGRFHNNADTGEVDDSGPSAPPDAPAPVPGPVPEPQQNGGAGNPDPLLPLSLLGNFGDAYTLAKNALDNPDCGGLFGISANSMDPATLLDSLRNGLSDSGFPNSGLGYMNASTGLAADTAAITSEIGRTFLDTTGHADKNANGDRVVSDKIAVSISIQAWNSHDAAYNAGILLHELGHVFNDRLGAGGSAFVQDVDPITGRVDQGAEEFNASLEKKCIK